MPNYRRSRVAGGCYFFTIHLLERHDNRLLVEHIGLLREVVKWVRLRYPFHIDGCVILPEHMHCIWTLPKGDANYGLRIRLIKSLFSKALPKIERRSLVRRQKGERGAGNGDFGNIKFEMKRITVTIWTIYTITPSSMDGWKG